MAFGLSSSALEPINSSELPWLKTFDLRWHWIRQKRIQGSHMYEPRDAERVIALVADGRMRACHTAAHPFDEVGAAHEALIRGSALGKTTIHVGTTRP